jgi:hypothetical protein
MAGLDSPTQASPPQFGALCIFVDDRRSKTSQPVFVLGVKSAKISGGLLPRAPGHKNSDPSLSYGCDILQNFAWAHFC